MAIIGEATLYSYRDSTDTQSLTIQINGELISIYDNVPFTFECSMTNKTPSGAKRNHKSTKPKSCQMENAFPSLYGLVQNCVMLS